MKGYLFYSSLDIDWNRIIWNALFVHSIILFMKNLTSSLCFVIQPEREWCFYELLIMTNIGSLHLIKDNWKKTNLQCFRGRNDCMCGSLTFLPPFSTHFQMILLPAVTSCFLTLLFLCLILSLFLSFSPYNNWMFHVSLLATPWEAAKELDFGW